MSGAKTTYESRSGHYSTDPGGNGNCTSNKLVSFLSNVPLLINPINKFRLRFQSLIMVCERLKVPTLVLTVITIVVVDLVSAT
jgi:hypothetical protein